MSRFFKSMIVLLAIVAMATPVMAEDMLSLGGQMRVRGMFYDAGDVEGDDSTSTFMDQRLRIGGKFSIADGVSVTFRTDVSEGTWGADNGFGRFGSVVAWDRAHLDLDGSMFHLRAGTQYIGFGNAYAVDVQETALKFSVKGSVPVDAFFSILDTNGADTDSYLYGAQAGFGPVKGYFAGLKGGGLEEVYLLGASFNFNMDAVKIKGALDYFTGDSAFADTDAMGTQFFVDAAFAASEAMTVGGAFYYALGADDDEVQYSFLGNGFNGYDPLNYGPLENDNLMVIVRPADVFGDAGVMGLQVYGNFKVTDAVNFTGSVAYVEPEDDDNSDADSAIFYNIGAKYAFMANTSLAAQVQYVDIDEDDVDELLSAEVKLSVNF